MTIRIMAGFLLARCSRCSTVSGYRPTACATSGASRRRSRVQSAENDRLKERNRTLAAEVRDLKEGREAIEERARTDLGMVAATRPSSRSCRPRPRRRAASAPSSGGRPRPTSMTPRRGAGPSSWRPGAASASAARAAQAIHAPARPANAVLVAGRAARESPIVDGIVVALAPRRSRWQRLAESRDPRVRTLRRRRRGARIRSRTRSTRWTATRGTTTGCWCTMPRVPACGART